MSGETSAIGGSQPAPITGKIVLAAIWILACILFLLIGSVAPINALLLAVGGIALLLLILGAIPVPLFVASFLSVTLVVLVGLLIAFMQYQTRLLRSHPGITGGQIVYYVKTEEAINEQLDILRGLSATLTKQWADFQYIQNEVEFRVRRICALFDTPTTSAFSKCSDFLTRIPFEGTVPAGVSTPDNRARTAAALVTKTSSADSAAQPPPDLLKAIGGKFVEIMGNPAVGDVKFVDIVQLYHSDLATIALLNQRFQIEVSPEFNRNLQIYRSTCDYVEDLTRVLIYKATVVGPCGKQNNMLLVGPGQPVGPSPVSSPHTLEGGAGGINRNTASRSDQGARSSAPQPTVQSAQPDAQRPSVLPPGGQAQFLSDAPAGAGAHTSMPNVPGVAGALGLGAPNFGSAAPGASPASGLPSNSPQNVNAEKRPDADKQRDFELVTHYMFYEKLSLGYLKDILLSPTEFLAFLLVCFCGVLGAMLRIVFASYTSGKDSSARNLVVGPILGLICALVVYILFRAGFIAITDRAQSSDATLSPFVIAIVSMASGLLSERAIDAFRKAGGTWLGSVEDDQPGRWAAWLKEEVTRTGTSLEQLAQRLDISADRLCEWAEERSLVPADKQREIAIALGVPTRRLFTDLPPDRPTT